MPRNYYGYSKYMGELYSERASAAILRVNFFGRSLCPKRESFTDWLYRLAQNNETIFAFKDVYFSALSISTLVKMIEAVLINFRTGTFNIGSKEGLSKFEFAKYFLEELRFSTEKILPRNVGELEFLKAYRPKDMRVNVTLFEDTFNINLPTLKDEIKEAAGEYDQNTK
jgi:dTDP-4-dehydrorhamnose reductase